MNLLNRIFLLALFASLLLASCNERDEVFYTEVEPEEITPTEQTVNGLMSRATGNGESVELECLTIEYPFDFLLSDSSTSTVTSDEDLLAFFSESDPAVYPVDFVYPLEVTDEDDNVITVNDVEELAELFAACVPGTGWGDPGTGDPSVPAWSISFDNSCYQLVFPFEVINLENEIIEVEDEEDLIDLLATGELFIFAFPLDLEDTDGNVVTAENEQQLIELLNECSNGPGGPGLEGIGCYRIKFPITLVLFDGSTVEATNGDEFMQVVLSGDWSGFEYPITLIDGEDNDLVLNSDDELDQALAECDNGWPATGEMGCYNFDYPIQFSDGNGNFTTINNVDEYYEYLNTASGFFELVYPFTLIHVETGEEVTVNDIEEHQAALDECDF